MVVRTAFEAVKSSKSYSSKQYLILYFISQGYCEDCESEARFAWKNNPVFMDNAVQPFMVTDGSLGLSADVFGWPIVSDPSIKDEPFLQGRVAVIDSNGTLLSFYKAGSRNGYVNAYHCIDSALLSQTLTKGEPTIISRISSVDSGLTLSPPFWSSTRLLYNYRTGTITLGSLKQSRSLETHLTDSTWKMYQMPVPTSLQSDTLLNLLFCLRTEKSMVWSVLKGAGQIDTFVYGHHVKAFKHFWQEVGIRNLDAQPFVLRFDSVYGSFAALSPDLHYLWVLYSASDKLHNPSPLQYGILDLWTRKWNTISIPQTVPYSPPPLTTVIGNRIIILPDTGQLIILDTAGRETTRMLSCGIPGSRMFTLADSDSTLIILQQIDGVRYAIQYSIDGIRLSPPLQLNDSDVALHYDGKAEWIVLEEEKVGLILEKIKAHS